MRAVIGLALAGVKTPWIHRGTRFSNLTGSVTSFSVDIGRASADRLVVVGVAFQGVAGITSVVVDPAGANVTLTQDALAASGNSGAVYSGLVASGDGPKIIQLTLVSGSFLNRAISVWTINRLTSGLKKQSATAVGATSTTISTDSGDVLFGASYNVGNLRVRGAPEHPVTQRSNQQGFFQEMLLGTTGTLTLSNTVNMTAAFATYR